MRRIIWAVVTGAWLLALAGCNGESTQTPDTATPRPKGGLQRPTDKAPAPSPLPRKP
jgi:hypothetical protein